MARRIAHTFLTAILFLAFLMVVSEVPGQAPSEGKKKENQVKKKKKKKVHRKPVLFYRPLQSLDRYQVKLSHQPGIYDSAFYLRFTLPPGMQLFYQKNHLTSGSPLKYNVPIRIDSMVNLQCRISQRGRKTDTIYCASFVVKNRHQLPILCISVNPEAFFPPDGITEGSREITEDNMIINHGNALKKKEIDCYAEFFYQGKLVEYGAYGVKPHGGFTLALPEKSLQLIAHENYGDDCLEYKFFENKPFNKFKSLVIRTSGGDQYGTRFKDVCVSSIAQDLGLDQMAYQQGILYVNGLYFGIYNFREKVNKNFLIYNHHADPDSTIILQERGVYNKHYDKVVQYAIHQNQSPEFPAEINKKIDVDNYLNFSILQIFHANIDSRGNLKFWKASNLDNRYRWIFYDGDASAGSVFIKKNFLAERLSPEQTEWYNPYFATILLRSLIANQEMKTRFINQYCLLLSTYLRSDSLLRKVQYFKKKIEPEIPRHVRRRNNIWHESVKSWNRNVGWLEHFYRKMPAAAYKQLQLQFNLADTSRILIATNIKTLHSLRINESDLRFQNISGIFFSKLPLKVEATGENHLYKFKKWMEDGDSVPVKTITISDNLRLNALYVHKDMSEKRNQLIMNRFYCTMQVKRDMHWLEIKNQGESPVKLRGTRLYEDNSHWSIAFPDSSLKPGQSLVICNDSTAWRRVNRNFSGLLLQSEMDNIFRQSRAFVLIDDDDQWIDSMYVNIPDALLNVKNHFLVSSEKGVLKYESWNNKKNPLDWSVKLVSRTTTFDLLPRELIFRAGIPALVGLVVLITGIVLIIRRLRKHRKNESPDLT